MDKKNIRKETSDKFLNVKTGRHVLRLYITGASSKSMRAVENLKNIAEKYIKDNYELEVIDIYQQPILAETDQILAIPTLVVNGPFKVRRMVGDLSDTNKVLDVLGLNF